MRLKSFVIISFAALASTAAFANEPTAGAVKSDPNSVNWGAFYLGLNWGVGAGNTFWSNPTGVAALSVNRPRFPATGTEAGLLGGVTLGWNYQSGPWVSGLEADLSKASLVGSAVCGGIYGSVGGTAWKCLSQTDWLGSISGKCLF